MPPFITTAAETTQITDAMKRLADLGWQNRDTPPVPPLDPILDIHE